MGNYVYPNRQGLPHMHCLKETTDEEQNSSPSLETSHAMSLYIWTVYMNWWRRSFYTKFLQTAYGYIRHLWHWCHVCQRDNFPGNNDPYTVPPSTRGTGTITDTRSCIYIQAFTEWTTHVGKRHITTCTCYTHEKQHGVTYKVRNSPISPTSECS